MLFLLTKQKWQQASTDGDDGLILLTRYNGGDELGEEVGQQHATINSTDC